MSLVVARLVYCIGMTIRGIPKQSRDVIMYSWLSLYICLYHHHPHHRTEVAAVTVAEGCFVSLRWFLYSCTCDSRHSQLRWSRHLGSPKVAATTTNEIGLVHVLRRVLGLWRVCGTVKLPRGVVPQQTGSLFIYHGLVMFISRFLTTCHFFMCQFIMYDCQVDI